MKITIEKRQEIVNDKKGTVFFNVHLDNRKGKSDLTLWFMTSSELLALRDELNKLKIEE